MAGEEQVLRIETHGGIIWTQIGRGIARQESCTLIWLFGSSLLIALPLFAVSIGIITSSKLQGYHCAEIVTLGLTALRRTNWGAIEGLRGGEWDEMGKRLHDSSRDADG
ncbi:hypothetical protein BO78DRAFT_401744 [Aspergillus sclerotiicarbonarius CBS 121057]|uniref:Uncharacterized protein n=1 Tax=Aspergillus sclerotiicarbonarius (strain CBS 121057 / IBT 28362) TaxID=1448318 RepID=A0A319EB22_ASPSB|nr:hypothetical protein BO78DRAFT_401744 [Aspergillus sclerotiicarbonarius CBS 121057]